MTHESEACASAQASRFSLKGTRENNAHSTLPVQLLIAMQHIRPEGAVTLVAAVFRWGRSYG